MRPDVALLYDADCPNVAHARSNLQAAFEMVGEPARWRELDRSRPDTPPEWKGFGSPTILVNGRDVAGDEPCSEGGSCRLYRTDDGSLARAPRVEQIAELLRGETEVSSANGAWKQSLAVLPSLGIALLPNVTCPACWPAYAALLSSLGIGFLPTTRYLFPLTLLSLAIALGMLGWRAKRTSTLASFALGAFGALLIVLGRFALESNAVLYLGIAVLCGASLWNAWPRRKGTASAALPQRGRCPACPVDE